jgi:HPt (histidine-containing phosphotransfer) domain-containing protein
MKWQFESGKEQMLTLDVYPVPMRTPDRVVLNLDELMMRVGYDQQLLAEIICLFQEDAPLRMTEMEAALAGFDSVGFEHAAHAIKGMLSSFAATQAADTAYTLENLGHSKRWVNASHLVSSLEQQVAELSQHLQELVCREPS